MSEEPEVPQPVPAIPRGPLWLALVIPPLLTGVANAAIGIVTSGGSTVVSLCVPLFVFLLIVALTFWFSAIVERRYRGRFVFYLNFAYFLGQIVVCLTVYMGTCVTFFKN